MMCAAKLKKRALAEYQSQVKEEDQKQKSSKSNRTPGKTHQN